MRPRAFREKALGFLCVVSATRPRSWAMGILLGAAVPIASMAASGIGTPLTPAEELSGQSFSMPERLDQQNLVARDAKGDFAVLWTNSVSSTDSTTTNYIRWFAADGTPLTPAQAAPGASGLGMDDAGDTVAFYGRAINSPKGTYSEYFAQVYDLYGRKQGAEITIAYLPYSYLVGGALAVAGNGDFTVAWNVNVLGVSTSGIILDYTVTTLTRSFHIDGTPLSDKDQVVYRDRQVMDRFPPNEQQSVKDLGINRTTGEYALVYGDGMLSRSPITLQIFDRTGTPLSPAVQLPTGPIIPQLGLGNVGVAVTDVGDVIVAFNGCTPSSSECPIRIARYSSSGVLKDGPINVGLQKPYTDDLLTFSPQGLVATADNGFMLTCAISGLVNTGASTYPNMIQTRVYGADDRLLKTFPVTTETVQGTDDPAAINTFIDPQGNLRVVWGLVNTQVFQGLAQQ